MRQVKQCFCILCGDMLLCDIQNSVFLGDKVVSRATRLSHVPGFCLLCDMKNFKMYYYFFFIIVTVVVFI